MLGLIMSGRLSLFIVWISLILVHTSSSDTMTSLSDTLTSSSRVTTPLCNVTFVPDVIDGIYENEAGHVEIHALCDWSGHRDVAHTTVTMEMWTSEPRYLDTSAAPWYVMTRDDVDNVTYDVYNVTLYGRGFGRFTLVVDVCVVEDALLGLSHSPGGVPGVPGQDLPGSNAGPPVPGWYVLCRPAASLPVPVLSRGSLVEIIFLAVLGVMIVVYNLGFGCALHPHHVLEIVRRPIGPAIGAVCQFIFMAPLSFGIAKMMNVTPETGLGLLAVGSAPGGGGSNVFAKLLDGDLELSITMSFISTLISLGMTPLWIWFLGRYFTDGRPTLTIPIQNVFTSLAVVTVPVIIGGVITKFKPKVGKKIAWGLKPLTGIIGVVFISMGIYLNLPALLRADWRILTATTLVPLVGYSLGACAAAIFKRSKPEVITISLETGFQNFSLSLMMVASSLESPESEMASVVPILYTFLSAAMPALAFIIKMIVGLHKFCRRKVGAEQELEITQEENPESSTNSLEEKFTIST